MKKILYFLAGAALLSATACNKDDENFDDVTLNVAQTYTIPNGTGTEWQSYNDYVATVKGNVVTGVIAGETKIESALGSFMVKVVPTNNMFLEPCLNWGNSKSEVKKFMESYTGFVLADEDDNELTYTGTGDVFMYLYEFGSKDNDLDTSYIAVDSDKVTAAQFSDYMNQRYIYVSDDDENDIMYMVSTDFKTVAGIYVIELDGDYYWAAEYIPYTDATRAPENIKRAFDGKVRNAKFQKATSVKAVNLQKQLKAEFAK